MAQSAATVLLASILLATFNAAVAVEFIVGGDSGWVLPVQANAIGNYYTTWADSNIYTVGDSLVFKYNKDVHSVLQVSGAAFADCTTADPLGAFKDGNTTIQLEKEGRMWFICGAPRHCAQGQKFKITVLAAGAVNASSEAAPSMAPAAAPESGASNALLKSSKTVVILRSIVAGAYFFLQVSI